MKFLLYAVLAYLLYRIFSGFFRSKKLVDGDRDGNVIDEMVQDPSCMTYVPRMNAVKKVIGGQAFFFCSEACAHKYQEENKT